MVPTSIILLAMASAAANAFKIPADQPDGVYAVPSGPSQQNATHTLLQAADPVNARDTADGYSRGRNPAVVRRGLGISKRLGTVAAWDGDILEYVPVSYCSGDEYKDHASVDRANFLVGQQLDSGVQATYKSPHVYSKVNDVVAYFCIFPGSDNNIGSTSKIFREALDKISVQCGAYHAGECSAIGGGLAYGWGADPAMDFCGGDN